jgi:S1-C subfamily serine protease
LGPFLILLALGGLLVWRFWPHGTTGLDPTAQPVPVMARGDLAADEKATIEIYEHGAPSSVHVTNLAERRGYFSLDVQQVPRGTGSGFVWDQDGHIVTNYHVVEGASAVQVVLPDHSSYPAQKVWTYPEKDIAVIWIKAPKSKLVPIPIGTSHDLKVGQKTFAIGNPFGLDQSMTTGIVSALGREIESANGRTITGLIQTSAAINPGNSGGLLLDSAGRLIGMNTAILSPSGASAGIGFAIPVDEINDIVPQLIRRGEIIRPRLGVEWVPDQMAENLGVENGAAVMRVMPDSAAAQAGLRGIRQARSGHIQLGDVIVAMEGQPIHSGRDLIAAIEKFKVGQTITVTILRDGQRQDVQVTLKRAE